MLLRNYTLYSADIRYIYPVPHDLISQTDIKHSQQIQGFLCGKCGFGSFVFTDIDIKRVGTAKIRPFQISVHKQCVG